PCRARPTWPATWLRICSVRPASASVWCACQADQANHSPNRTITAANTQAGLIALSALLPLPFMRIPSPCNAPWNARSSYAGVAEAAFAASAGLEVLHLPQGRPGDREEHQLGNPVPRRDRNGSAAAVPQAHHQRDVVIGVDQADQVAQHQAVLMP